MAAITRSDNTGNASRRDLAYVLAGTVIFFGFSATFELSEKVLALTRPWERYQLDELPGVLLFLAAALSWFGWRRVREARVELARRMALEKQLAETLAENRRLSLSHVRVQEDERRQLARELHDELGQHLNAIKIDAVSIRNWTTDKWSEVHSAALTIIDVTNHVHDTIRDLLRRLRPVGLDELGLTAALEHLVQNWQARNPATQAVLKMGDNLDGLGENENMTCYRIVQEALNNVTRHAHAHNLTISLVRRSDSAQRERIVLTIADDGAGTSSTLSAGGLGLVGMRERVEALGGDITIESTAGQGFRIHTVLPLHASEA
ncbi:MAG TPA: ATP-binding protein [Burkholderiales bacterium]|nr:ATP-binding protein [Burkholderiales bacterium]